MSLLKLKDIRDAQINFVRDNILDFKTVACFAGKFNPAYFEKKLAPMPFDLIYFDDDNPDESQRLDDGVQTIRKLTFVHTVGSRNLRGQQDSDDEVLDLLDALEENLDGKKLLIGEYSLPPLEQGRRFYVDTTPAGIVIYQVNYSMSFIKI